MTNIGFDKVEERPPYYVADYKSQFDYIILPIKKKIANGYFVENQIETSKMYSQERYCLGLGDLREVSNTSFIDQLINFIPRIDLDFSLIPTKYKGLFSTL